MNYLCMQAQSSRDLKSPRIVMVALVEMVGYIGAPLV